MSKINDIDIALYKRKKLRQKILGARNGIKTQSFFDKMIKLTKEYEDQTKALENSGHKLSISAEWLTPVYWQLLKKSYNGKFETRKKHINTITENDTWQIIISWTVPPNNCSCSTPVENVKNYLEKLSKTIGVKLKDTQSYIFNNQQEVSYIFELNSIESTYISILESAKYILDISSVTEKELCNVGIYGKKIEKN